jgi:hypothetical protein
VPAALMVTEAFRLWSPRTREVAAFPLTMVGPPKTGTAGEIELLPFIGVVESDFPCRFEGACEEAERVFEAATELRPEDCGAVCGDAVPLVGADDW